MKKVVFVGIMCLLSGCATLSPKSTPPDNLGKFLSTEEKHAFNIKMNTVEDNVPTTWRNEADDTGYKLTASEAHLNAQGLPCRSYTLVINPDYHRKKVTTAVACRDNGDWTSSAATEDDGD